MTNQLFFSIAWIPLVAGSLFAQTFQTPSQAVMDVLNAPEPPGIWPNQDGSYLLIGQVNRNPSIAELSRPFLSLAGMRVNPSTNRLQLLTYTHSLAIQPTSGGPSKAFTLPAGGKLDLPLWNPDGKTFAVGNTTANAFELMVGGVDGSLRTIPNIRLNGLFGSPLDWMDSRTLLVRTVPSGRAVLAPANDVPSGPVIQEAGGQAGPVPTFQDMLRNPRDEDAFDYYGTSQVILLDVVTGKITNVGKPGVYLSLSSSPDSKYLLVHRLHRPYSYVLPYSRFPEDVEVWDKSGGVVHSVAKLPLRDNIPVEGVATGPRQVGWNPTQPSVLTWVEALDGGDPRRTVPHRDKLVFQRSPFSGEPVEVARVANRFASRLFVEGTSQALVADYDRTRRWLSTSLVDFGTPGSAVKPVWSRHARDKYKDPGEALLKTLPNGQQVVRQTEGYVFLAGEGSSPSGDHPFLDRMSLSTGKIERLFQSGDAEYERFAALVSNDGSKFITIGESPTEPPNAYLRTGPTRRKITNFADPTPQLRGITKQLVRYKRKDGVDLSFTLYLPPGYQQGTKLPTVVSAYPLDFNDPDIAGQVGGSTKRFTQLPGTSFLFYVLAGYALLENASMPVVGDPEKFNDTFVDQIVSSAKAAIDQAASMGVTDPDRVGVIGHSYGAFMTANLLAHCDLFRAGVARSGAYNRTLTPFGFQTEKRTYWEAGDVYTKVSPFTYAHKIKEPILLIHGMADDNTGTYPVQSERMYAAIRGNGGTVRLVMLPNEAHAYRAKETVQHVLYEMISWFNKYVKNAPPLRSSANQ